MRLSFKLLLRLHMMTPSSCFRVPNDAEDAGRSSAAAHPHQGVVRVISLYEGGVQIYRGVVGAGEIMEKNPKHLLCRWDSLIIGQHVPAMSPGDMLLPGNSYFLLPAAFFRSSPLSFLSLASICDPKKLIPAFTLQKTDSGKLRIVLLVHDASTTGEDSQEEEEEDQDAGKKRLKMTMSSKVCTTEALQKDYRQLVCCSRTWKPKLETISEYSDQHRRRRRIRTFPGIPKKRKTSATPSLFSIFFFTNLRIRIKSMD